jgi:hypothetical protein
MWAPSPPEGLGEGVSGDYDEYLRRAVMEKIAQKKQLIRGRW